MNKVVMSAIGGLAVGVAVGYIGAPEENADAKSGLSETIIANQRAPRFGESRTTGGQDVSAKKITKFNSATDILREANPLKRVANLVEYYSALRPEQMEAEAKKLKDLSWEDRFIASNLLFSKWAEVSPRQAMEYANKLGFRSQFEKMAILKTWGATNPEAAIAYYAENKNILDGRSAGVIASEWARTDVNAAMAWAAGLSEGEQRNAMNSIIQKIAETDPAVAAAKLASLTPEQLAEGGRMYDVIANQWAKKDWAATEQWLATLPADMQENARRNAIQGLAESNPRAAADQVAKLSEGNVKDRAISTVAQVMAESDPAAAADWVLKNASESGFGQSAGSVIASWVYTDTTGAKNWVESLPEGRGKEQALMMYSSRTPSKDYGDTIALASSIKDEGVRNAAVSAAARNWMRDEPEAAKAWVESSSLNDNTKQRILDPRNSRRGGRAVRMERTMRSH